MSGPRLHGVMAEYAKEEKLLAAAKAARARGYRRLDAYAPYPVEGLEEALDLPPSPMPKIILAGGIAGCATGYGLQYWASVLSYPLNSGGRPLNSWPAFIPVTFELTILFASLAAAFGMILLNGLPLPYHPAFNVPRFSLASKSRFFLCLEARDPLFDASAASAFLKESGAEEVYEVEA
jgi:ActD protein